MQAVYSKGNCVSRLGEKDAGILYNSSVNLTLFPPNPKPINLKRTNVAINAFT